MSNSNNNNWKRIGGFSRTGTQNYVRTNDAAMGGTTFGSTDVSNNTGNTTLRIGNNAGVVFINGDIDMSGGPTVVAPVNRIRNVRDPIADHDVATKFYVDKTILSLQLANQERGPTGEMGPPGIGFGGQDGQEGPTGATGCTGAAGPPGSVIGVTGATGSNGGIGATGARGAVGATGPAGSVGEKGEKGDQGIQGIQGSNGAILWLNPDGDSQLNELITDSYLLSNVPINTNVRTIGPISVSATYGNTNKVIPSTRFFNKAEEVSTLAVVPSGVWVVNIYANVPSVSDANQISLYAAVFMITGTSNQPSPDSLIIETKDGGDSGYYPPRAAFLPDHVKYIGKSWTSNDNVLNVSSSDTTANAGTIIDSTTRKLYKLEMPVEFVTLKDALGNRENVYIQLQIYIRNTKNANQTANVLLYFQTDPNTNDTTYSYLQTTFGAVGIRGVPGAVGPRGFTGDVGATGSQGSIGATGSVGPTGAAGPVGPRGSQGATGEAGPTGSANSYGVQYAVQYRGNPSINPGDEGGNFRSDPNFRFIPGPNGYTNQITDATSGSVVMNDIACNSIHSPVYIQDTSITGSGSTRPRTYIRGGELVNSGPNISLSPYVVIASGTDTTNGTNSNIPVSVNDITNGVKLIHNYSTKKVTFQLHDENKSSGTTAIKFDLSGVNNIGNVSAAEDQFCIVRSSGAVGVGGITASQISSSTYTNLNRMLHVKGNIMVGSDPGGGGSAATNAMILLNRATSTPAPPMSDYPGIYHRSIASGEVTLLGSTSNNIVSEASGLGIISPNFITFQTGSVTKSNSIVINSAGNVSMLGRTNLNGPVCVGKNFTDIEIQNSVAPVIDISGTMNLSSSTANYEDVPRIMLRSRSIRAANDLPSTLSNSLSTTNEIRGVIPTENSGFLRLSAQSPGNSCIDLVGENTSTNAGRFNNSVRISTSSVDRMVINGSGNVGIGTTQPTVRLDVVGAARVTAASSTTTALTTSGRIGVNQATPATALDVTGDARVTAASSTTTALTTTGRVGINQATPATALDVTGDARVTAASSTSTALTTTGRVGINVAAPTVPLDVAGAANIAGELNMNSNKIFNLANPTSNQDAATKRYVDLATTDMATSSSVSTAITNALGSSGTDSNRPTIRRDDTINATQILTYVDVGDYPTTDGTSKRGLLRCDGNLTYNPNTNTLAAGTFSGAISGSSGYFSGNVGIRGSASVPLHVFGSVNQNSSMSGTRRFIKSDGSSGTWNPDGQSLNVSIISENEIWCKGTYIWITSDQRIKTNIVNLNADKMINIFRNLRPISFDFIDPMKNYGKKHFGFIAQEVKEVLPEGISLNSDVIPNNMKKGEIDQKSKIETSFTLKPTDTDITLQYLLLTTETPLIFDISNSYSSTNIYKFKIYGGDKWSKEHDIYIRSDYNVTDDKYTYVIGLKKEAYDVVITEATLFVYGQYVNDLHILDHDTIYTVATAALKEVDRQQQADKARIEELEATVAAQQSLINDILERLKALEKA